MVNPTKTLITVTTLFTLISIFPGTAGASPGTLDVDGCHHCTSNCRDYNLKPNEYHCHEQGNVDKILGIADMAAQPRNPSNLEDAKRTSVIIAASAGAFIGYKIFSRKSWEQ